VMLGAVIGGQNTSANECSSSAPASSDEAEGRLIRSEGGGEINGDT
jgi:hypothetical protein